MDSEQLAAKYTLPLPVATDSEAVTFLEGLGGDSAGAGRAMRRVGIDAPSLRSRYKREVEMLARQRAERLEAGSKS